MNTLKKLGCLIFILALSLPCFARKPIKWKGHWKTNVKSIISECPISAWVEDNNKDLLLEFSANLGTVEVTVTNQAGEVVYNQFVKAEAMSPTIISLEEEVKNGYILYITNETNNVYGNIFTNL